jgi:hypothetical protein
MSPSSLRVLLVVGVGLLAPLWWTWAVNNLIYALYLASGSPERPSPIYGHALLLLPSAALGLLVGAGVSVVCSSFPVKGWATLWGAIFIGSAVFSVAVAGSLVFLAELFRTSGNVVFLVATSVPPTYVYFRRRGA